VPPEEVPPEELPEEVPPELPDDEPPLDEPPPHGPHLPEVLPVGRMQAAPGQQSELVVHPPPHATHTVLEQT
jgi:hypothetical protein